MNQRGAVWIVALLAVSLLGGGLMILKPKWLHGDSKRAQTSTATTTELLASQTAQAGAAAAYVQTMGEVVGTLPASKEKDFLGRASGIALSYLPKPDPQKIIEAQNLKIAVLTGQLELADRLTGSALQRADLAEQRTARAIAAKRASDLELQQVAAARLAEERQQNIVIAVAVLLLALYLWTKASHISPLTLSRAVQEIRTGSGETNPAIAALDGATTPFQQANTALMHWARTKLAKLTS